MEKRIKSRTIKLPEKRKKEQIEYLKGEIKKLKKQVKHLRKDNHRLMGYREELEEMVEQEETLETPKPKFKCPKCSSTDVSKLVLGERGEYFVCQNRDCGARGKC